MPVDFSITINRDDIGWFGDQTAEKLERLVKKTTFDVEAEAKTRCPVDTGALRSSIQSFFENGGMTGVIAVGMEYAPFVEFGTDRQRAQPYLGPAVEGQRAAFVEGIARIMRGGE